MCKIIFSDIDGTLLDSNQKISFDTKKKIQELAKKGIPFVLASSRLESGVVSCHGGTWNKSTGDFLQRCTCT